MKLGLKGRAVLVTGGNRGIGLAIALAFAEEGAKVAICGRDRSALDKARLAIAAHGGQVEAFVTDLFTAEGCAKVVGDAAAALGCLDILISNASTNISGKLETLSDDALMERVMGKTLATMRCARAALPHLRISGQGRIICIGGTSARTPAARSLPSGLGNSSLVNFAKHFSIDTAPDGITVNVVHPPFTRTDRYNDRLKAKAELLGSTQEEAEAAFISDFPIGRLVEPSDIAPLSYFSHLPRPRRSPVKR
jgi:NAD(P)-dependent dehydrogenase (short-subunit alcohol dehydrogenase family)